MIKTLLQKKTFILFLFAFAFNSGFSQLPVTFDYTGAVQTWTVPAGLTSMDIICRGAAGGGVNGGNGAEVWGTFSVTPGEILYIYVGGAGDTITGGYNGGGNGGDAALDEDKAYGGGGASDVRLAPYTLTDRIIVAGGGGGMSGGNTDVAGGNAGCPDGEDGVSSWGGAGGGTSSGPGAGGSPWGGGTAGAPGTDGVGGDGYFDPCYDIAPGAGGGGGVYGGGGGGTDCWGGGGSIGGGGGGAGSSLIPSGGDCEGAIITGNGSVEFVAAGSAGGVVIPLGAEAEEVGGSSFEGSSIDESEVEKPKLYPNPVEKLLFIELKGTFTFRIMDNTGRLVHVDQGTDKKSIELSELSDGAYFVHINGSDQHFVQKFIKI